MNSYAPVATTPDITRLVQLNEDIRNHDFALAALQLLALRPWIREESGVLVLLQEEIDMFIKKLHDMRQERLRLIAAIHDRNEIAA